MTNSIAVVLAGLITISLIADLALNSGAAFVFLGKKMLDLIDMVAIWR